VEIKVLVADQERTFAEALAARLDGEEDITVVGAVQLGTRSHSLTAGKSVDVVVLDSDLAGGAANRLCAELARWDRPVQVIALSSSAEPERIVLAIQAGAKAWVRKDQPLTYLLRAIRGVARGETWLLSGDLSNVVRFLLQEQDRRRKEEQMLSILTPRERAVLTCLAEGAGHRDAVAEQLHLSVNTVRTHLQNLMAKLGVHSALEAVALTREQLTRDEGDRLSADGLPLRLERWLLAGDFLATCSAESMGTTYPAPEL
jgi:two-component system NarL family response regulator